MSATTDELDQAIDRLIDALRSWHPDSKRQGRVSLRVSESICYLDRLLDGGFAYVAEEVLTRRNGRRASELLDLRSEVALLRRRDGSSA